MTNVGSVNIMVTTIYRRTYAVAVVIEVLDWGREVSLTRAYQKEGRDVLSCRKMALKLSTRIRAERWTPLA